MQNLRILFLLFFILPQLSKAHAACINTEDHPDGLKTMHEYIQDHQVTQPELRVLQKEEKRFQKLESRLQKLFAKKAEHRSLGNIHDPVDKWFWIWAIGWGAGILITIISGASIASGFLGILWLSLFIIGSVALVIWLIKKFGNH